MWARLGGSADVAERVMDLRPERLLLCVRVLGRHQRLSRRPAVLHACSVPMVPPPADPHLSLLFLISNLSFIYKANRHCSPLSISRTKQRNGASPKGLFACSSHAQRTQQCLATRRLLSQAKRCREHGLITNRAVRWPKYKLS